LKLDRIVLTPEILSRLQDVLVLRAADGTILDANPAALKTYGYSIEQIRGMCLRDLEAPESQADVDERLRVAAERGGIFDAMHRRADGTVFPVELVSVPVAVDEDPALLMIVRDTTERETYEAMLRESRAALQSILDHAPLLVTVSTLDGRYTLVNRRVEDLLGIPGEKLVGRMRADVMPKDRADELSANDRSVIQKGVPATFYELYDEPDGQHIYLSTRFPLFTDDGEIALVSCVSADITEAKRTEAELANANIHLAETVKETASLVGRIVEARDPYTQGHETRVAELATMIAVEMGLPKDEIEGVEMAALLHDIGKMSVPAEILSKPGPLSQQQFALIQCHPKDGYEILQAIDFPWPVAEAVLQHHERMNGTGYPRGLHGDEICVIARILAVADVVEAVSSHRPYRPALGIETAIAAISEHPEEFDQVVTAALLSVYESGQMRW